MSGSILIAEIGAAHGVRGEVRVKALTADPASVGDYGPLHDDRGRTYVVASLRPLKDDMLVVRFEGVADRTAAEKLTRIKLYVDRSVLPEPDEDEFYHADLIGLAVETVGGETIGRVMAVMDFGAGDLLEVEREHGKSVFVPFTRAVVPTVDLAGGRLVVEPPDGLLDDGKDGPDGEPDEGEAP
jgi:16S rRNA processing protein RimM